MDAIDVAQLPAMAAPVWFVQFFKILGFTLHSVPMSLWYAGAVTAVGLCVFGGEHGRRFGSRLMRQMPFIIAVGINLGIVPLLFLQLAYGRVFYSATILMAWPWLAIIGMLIPAYYGVYFYAFALHDGDSLPRWKYAVGWASAGLFLAIGFIFSNAMSLMTNTGAWAGILDRFNVGGAALGLTMNHADASMWPRWLLMFGLAILTTAAWCVVDAAWWAGRESAAYRAWAKTFAWRLGAVGTIWTTVAGSWYVFGAWSPDVSKAMWASPTLVLTVATGAAPWLTLALLWLWRRGDADRVQASLIALAQVGVLAVNAVSRQWVQNLELKLRIGLDVAAQPVRTDYGPMFLFLITFVLGAAVAAWILAKLIKASARESGAY